MYLYICVLVMILLLAKIIFNKCMVKMYCCCIILKLDNEIFYILDKIN